MLCLSQTLHPPCLLVVIRMGKWLNLVKSALGSCRLDKHHKSTGHVPFTIKCSEHATQKTTDQQGRYLSLVLETNIFVSGQRYFSWDNHYKGCNGCSQCFLLIIWYYSCCLCVFCHNFSFHWTLDCYGLIQLSLYTEHIQCSSYSTMITLKLYSMSDNYFLLFFLCWFRQVQSLTN